MPGFFDVVGGEGQTPLFHGAAHFALCAKAISARRNR